MSDLNIWEKALVKLAQGHRKDGLVVEASHLEAAVNGGQVVNELTWRAVISAVCWWDNKMLEKAAREIKPEPLELEMVFRLGGEEVSRPVKLTWSRKVAVSIQAIHGADPVLEIGDSIGDAFMTLLKFSDQRELFRGMGKELVHKILYKHPITESEKEAVRAEFQSAVDRHLAEATEQDGSKT